MAKNYIQNSNFLSRADELIEMLNQTPLIKDKIYKYYAIGGGENRQYFSDFNAMKIDSIRVQIEKWKEQSFIDEKEYYFLLASLLESADKVANTASVYGAFLKYLKKIRPKRASIKPC